MPTIPTIDALPTPAPSTSNPTGFEAAADALIAALPDAISQANAMAAYITALLLGATNIGNATTLNGITWSDAQIVVGAAFTPSAFNSGSTLEVGAPGNAFWSDGPTAYNTANYYYDGAAKFAGTGYASYLVQSAGSLSFYSSDASGVAGGSATMLKRFGVTNAGRLNAITGIDAVADGNPCYMEFSQTGIDAKVTVGALGNIEANLSYNMDYSTAVHKFYDVTKNAHWIAIGNAGVYIQYAPAHANGVPSYDVWHDQGGLYNLFIAANGNVSFRGHLSMQQGFSESSSLGNSAWAAGNAVELDGRGNSIWGAGVTMTITANYFYDGADKFGGTGYASTYQQGGGVHTWKSSTASGVAGGAATMALLMQLDLAGVLTLPSLGGGGATWVAGDKYVICDSAGHLHLSALGPAS